MWKRGEEGGDKRRRKDKFQEEDDDEKGSGMSIEEKKTEKSGENGEIIKTAAGSITTTTKHNIYSHILLPLTEQRDRYSLAADLLLILEYTGSPSDSFPVKVDVESFLQTFFFDEKGD